MKNIGLKSLRRDNKKHKSHKLLNKSFKISVTNDISFRFSKTNAKVFYSQTGQEKKSMIV